MKSANALNSDGATRRQFLGTALGAAAAVSLDARTYARVIGANDRVNMGVIGCGGRGKFVMQRLVEEKADISFLCDPDPNQIDKARAILREKGDGGKPNGAVGSDKDFRKVLDRKELDAVLIAVPDHWHALPMMLACQAGKDIYMEKPTAYTIGESRAMVEMAKKTGNIVQIGTQQRNGPHYAEAVKRIRAGELGAIAHVRFWSCWNNTLRTGAGRSGNIGNPPDGDPPPGVDYDLWLGPAPQHAFNPNRFHWNYAYFWDYSGGMMSGWGVHHVDTIHWAMNAEVPRTVSAVGGTFVLKDNRETPDTLDAFFEYPGFTVHGSIYHTTSRLIEGRPYGIAFYGSRGTLAIDRGGYELWPEYDPKDKNPPPTVKVEAEASDNAHALAFLEAVKSRKRPFADLETGHRSTIPPLLANIAFRTGQKLHWDSVQERFVDCPAADKFLNREYRKPWVLPS